MKLSLPERPEVKVAEEVKAARPSAAPSLTPALPAPTAPAPLDPLTRAAIDALPRVAAFAPARSVPDPEPEETPHETQPNPRAGRISRVAAGAAALVVGAGGLLVASLVSRAPVSKGTYDPITPSAPSGDAPGVFNYDADLTGGTGVFE